MLWPACSGTEHQICGHITAPGPGVCDIALAESTEVHSVNNCVVFAEHCGRSAVAASSVRVLLFWWLGMRVGSVASRSQCCIHTQLWGPASGTSAVVGVRCRHRW